MNERRNRVGCEEYSPKRIRTRNGAIDRKMLFNRTDAKATIMYVQLRSSSTDRVGNLSLQ